MILKTTTKAELCASATFRAIDLLLSLRPDLYADGKPSWHFSIYQGLFNALQTGRLAA